MALGEASARETEKPLPPRADGDNSVAIENGTYRIELGETETGTADWFVGEPRTLSHEFFALQDGDGERHVVVRSDRGRRGRGGQRRDVRGPRFGSGRGWRSNDRSGK